MDKKTELKHVRSVDSVEQHTTVNEPQATPTARLLQAVGRGMLLSGQMVEVDDGIFSTCQEPLGKLGERILRARRMGVPLVEVTTFSDAAADRALRKLFDVPTGKLTLNIFRADGYERAADANTSNRVVVERVGLVVPYGDTTASGVATYTAPIESRLTRGDYRDYDNTRGYDLLGRPKEPGFVVPLFVHENNGQAQDIREALGRMMVDFRVASMYEGVVDGTVGVPEIQ